MTLDKQKLAEAKRVREEVGAAHEQLELAQVRYQHAIRRLSTSGGSLREIAQALGMSYQRVHQIVDVTGGKGAVRSSSSAGATCSFCGLEGEEVGVLVAGPGLHICDGCLALADEVLAEGSEHANGTHIMVSVADLRTRCSFCGRPRSRVNGMAQTPGQSPAGRGRRAGKAPAICDECLVLSREILTPGT